MIPAGAVPAPTGRPAPWNLGDVLILAATNAVGAVLLASAWFGASGTTSVRTEAGWLTLGVAGTVVAGAGDGAWLLAGLRSIAVRRRRMAGRVPGALAATPTEGAPTGEPASTPDPAGTEDPGSFVAVAGLGRYHRRVCAAVSGRAVVVASATEHDDAGRRPCGLCIHDGAATGG